MARKGRQITFFLEGEKAQHKEPFVPKSILVQG